MIDPNNPDFANTPASAHRPSYDYRPAVSGASPHVSIVTPFYNTGPEFHETARSVLRQSFQQWEWLIINDGSTDAGSLRILNEYRDCDPRLRVIDHPSNQGLSASRNTGFREAQTEYVVQLDSDDLLEPTAVEKWLWFLESYPEYAFVKGFTVGFGAQEYLWQRGFDERGAFLQENQVDATSMLRKNVHAAVGGYDESNRGGLEDWEFWLHCASLGFWGGMVPEFHDWYRRRASHADRWTNWNYASGHPVFRNQLKQRYPELWGRGLPQTPLRWHMPNDTTPDSLPCENLLSKSGRRALLLAPWMTVGGADKFNLDLLGQLVRLGWEVTVATTSQGDHSWLPQFSKHTPDIFALHRFLRLVDYPRFLRYLIGSRQFDVVLVSNSEISYLLLPYLRAHFPQVTFIDYCHMEEEQWKGGGYPRMAVEYQELLDLNIVSSEHLKGWMVQRGADAGRIEVCYTSVDPNARRDDTEYRRRVRRELGLGDEVPLILFAGRVCDQKQPRLLARVLHRLAQQGMGFAAVVAGDGPDLPWLRRFVSKHGLGDRIRLPGTVSNQRVQELMAGADIFFLPSKWEGIALSIYEAMACGLAVVAAEVGGQRELVTPDCGVLIPPGPEAEQTQRYVEVLAQLIGDPGLRQDMGRAGRQRVEASFRLEQLGERMAGLFDTARVLQTSEPRDTPGRGLARICASEAVEYIRLAQLSDQLWSERLNAGATQPEGQQTDWRTRAYAALYRRHEPIYRWYSSRGWTWLDPLRQRAKRMLFRRSEAGA